MLLYLEMDFRTSLRLAKKGLVGLNLERPPEVFIYIFVLLHRFFVLIKVTRRR